MLNPATCLCACPYVKSLYFNGCRWLLTTIFVLRLLFWFSDLNYTFCHVDACDS